MAHNRFLINAASIFLLTSLGIRATAQQPFIPPDALILVQPAGSQAMLSISYSGKVAHGSVRDVLTRLGKTGGWTLSTPQIADEDMKSSPRYGAVENLGTQTGASVTMSGAPLYTDGGFRLQPFIDALRDMKSYKLVFWVPSQKGFQGLRHFDSPAVTIDIVQDGNPYRYSVENHTHQGAVPRIPLTQAAASVSGSVATPTPPAGGHPFSLVGPVAGIALACGAVVFIFLRIVARGRNRSRKTAVTSRNSSQDSHHSYRI